VLLKDFLRATHSVLYVLRATHSVLYVLRATHSVLYVLRATHSVLESRMRFLDPQVESHWSI